MFVLMSLIVFSYISNVYHRLVLSVVRMSLTLKPGIIRRALQNGISVTQMSSGQLGGFRLLILLLMRQNEKRDTDASVLNR